VSPDSATFNQIVFQLSSLLTILDQRGILGWTNLVDYPVGAITQGSDGRMYQAILASGPATSVQDPISAPTYWTGFGGALATNAEARAFSSASTLISPLTLSEALKGPNQSLATNGYQRMPGGLIIQWGTTPSIATDGRTTITFPVAFPNACLSATSSPINNAGGGTFPDVTSSHVGLFTATTMQISLDSAGVSTNYTVSWIAIGW
jgi:hypothetical protein